VDLAGAYSIAMARMPQLDHSRSFTTTDLSCLISDVNTVGFAEVEFEFTEDIAYPCLPVKGDNSLIYPRCGVTCCTCYELNLAARQGATLRVIIGLVIPASPGESVLQLFVRDMRGRRAEHKKGTLSNNFYKLILNSLYGRFGLGISPKPFFNTRTGAYDIQGPNANRNPFLASSITGFIRAVLSELAHELATRGYLVVSMTTDGLITDCPTSEILRTVESPLVNLFKETTR
jgi:DNA polymerase type B, organellar and viral